MTVTAPAAAAAAAAEPYAVHTGTLIGRIRAGLAANLSAIDGCQVSAYMLSNPTPPCLFVSIDPAEGVRYDRAMQRGLDEYSLRVHGIVAVTSDQGAQSRLDEWLASRGPGSVKAAIESDRTLGGVADDTHVTAGGVDYGEYARETGGSVLACVWNVKVVARG